MDYDKLLNYLERKTADTHELQAASAIIGLRQRVAELINEVDHHKRWVAVITAERDALKQQRDKLVAAAEAIEIDAEECLDFDECTAMLVPIDTYHKLIEAIASINEK